MRNQVEPRMTKLEKRTEQRLAGHEERIKRHFNLADEQARLIAS